MLSIRWHVKKKKTPHSIEFSLIGVGRWIGTYKWHRLGGSRQHVGHQQGKHRLWQQDGHTCNIIHTHTRLVSYPPYRLETTCIRALNWSIVFLFYHLRKSFRRKRKENFFSMGEDTGTEKSGNGGKRGRFRKEEFNWSFSRNLRLQLRPLPSVAVQAFPRSFVFFPLLSPSFRRARFYGRTLEKSREFPRRRQTGASRESRQNMWVAFAESSTKR